VPELVSKSLAVARLERESPPGECVICALRDGRAGHRYMLAETPHTTTLLSRYPRRWGHVIVLVNAHVTRFSEVADGAWREASEQALRAARAVERALAPARCYVASLGTVRDDLPMSSPHVHLHVVPTYDAADRPKTVFDSQPGFYSGEDAEWDELHRAVLEGWRAVG
jgi:diadenosine tetraphosphate (Ap4A) HIT family hydrolase